VKVTGLCTFVRTVPATLLSSETLLFISCTWNRDWCMLTSFCISKTCIKSVVMCHFLLQSQFAFFQLVTFLLLYLFETRFFSSFINRCSFCHRGSDPWCEYDRQLWRPVSKHVSTAFPMASRCNYVIQISICS